MNTTTAVDTESVLTHLTEQGYAVLEGVLSASDLQELRDRFDEIMTREREAPFLPGDGPSTLDDAALEEFFASSYTVSKAELARLMQRARYTRAQNHGTPWPVPPGKMNKMFLHLPTLFDDDKSQRIWNLLNKGELFGRLVEHPSVLNVVRKILDPDCVLSDCSATSIGPHTGGGSWHTDVPGGTVPDPLPDFPTTTQNMWMLDDFTSENGATRVVPGTHLTRKKPVWVNEQLEQEVIITAPAGSVAIWLSNTWHRSGPNVTDRPRRGILCYYCRSWIKTLADFKAGIAPEMVARFSPTLRYLLGFSSNGLVRG